MASKIEGAASNVVSLKEYRERSEGYLAFLRKQPCIVCGSPPPNDPHHLKFAQLSGTIKVSDSFCVPLCRAHHTKLHNAKMREVSWWALQGIDALAWAKATWFAWNNQRSATVEQDGSARKRKKDGR